MPYALAATRVANLVSNNPKITVGAVLVAGAAFQKFAESGALRVSGAISDYGGIFETAADKLV